MSEVNSENLQTQLASAYKAKDELKSFEKLMSNREFRKIILEDFIVTNAARQVGNSIEVNFEEPQARDYALGEAQAGGYLKRWLAAQLSMLRGRINDIPNLEHNLAEIEAEGNAEPGAEFEE